uniref:Glycoside hydrolase n=1 Tax=viral metagenome TaxID=1070528 RepID=A0A6M3LAY4_9ZZZZ
MRRAPEGKGMYIWQLGECCGGDHMELAVRAVEAGLSWVALKIQERDSVYTPNLKYLDAAIAGLRAVGVEVWGWGYIYPKSRLGRVIVRDEAEDTIRLVRGYDVAGFIVNAEIEWQAGDTLAKRAAWADEYMDVTRAGLPDTPIGFSSFKYPTLHPLPWGAFLEEADFYQEQVYWEQAHNPASQLERSLREWRAYGDKPSVPAGSAYGVGAWRATVGDVDMFNRAVVAAGCPAIMWWDWQNADGTALWEAIKAHRWGGAPAPAPTPVTPSDALPRLWAEALRQGWTP